jgi:hypothetical protein
MISSSKSTICNSIFICSVSLKQKIFDQFQQKWRSDIENSPKGLSYRLFKENSEFEHYLDILPDKDRITYCRFRTGNHRLPHFKQSDLY